MMSGGAGLGYGYTRVLFMGFIIIMIVWARFTSYDYELELINNAVGAVGENSVVPAKGIEINTPGFSAVPVTADGAP